MRKKTDLFLIDGLPMLAPDENVELSPEDIDASDSGRDESGVMHRFVVQQGVGKWTFSYGCLTGDGSLDTDSAGSKVEGYIVNQICYLADTHALFGLKLVSGNGGTS